MIAALMVAGVLLLAVVHRHLAPQPYVTGPWFALWGASTVFAVLLVAAWPHPAVFAAAVILAAAAAVRFFGSAVERRGR